MIRRTIECTKVNGSRTRCKVTVFWNGKMDVNTKESSKMTKSMAMESSYGKLSFEI